jgi:hypothetical protein
MLVLCALAAPTAGMAATCDLEANDGDVASYTCDQDGVEIDVEVLGITDMDSEMGLYDDGEIVLGITDMDSEMGLYDAEIVLDITDMDSEMGFTGSWSSEDGVIFMSIDGDDGAHEVAVDGSGVAVVDGEEMPTSEVAVALFDDDMAEVVGDAAEVLEGMMGGAAGAEMMEILAAGAGQ